MANFTYSRDIPDANNNPSVDQPPMKVNTNSLDDLIGVDHINFNENDGGYHTIIHQKAQVADPAPIPGPPQVGQVYVKSYTPDTTGAVADTQLYSQTALGGVSQLTGNNAQNDGWVWSGGLLYQWGRVSQAFGSGITTGTVTYKDRVALAIPFPNNCFMVTTTPIFLTATPPNATASISIDSATLTRLKFDWQFFSNSSNYKGFFWFAIGN